MRLFVPVRRPSTDDVQRLQTAAALTEGEVEEMVADFDALRRGGPLPSRSGN